MENLVTDVKKCFDKVPEFDKLNSKQILWNSTGNGLRQHAPSHENDIKRILDYINVLVSEGKIHKDNFSVLDMCCGDVVVLNRIKNTYPESKLYGFDILSTYFNVTNIPNVSLYSNSNRNTSNDILIHNCSIQDFLKQNLTLDTKIDVVVTKNTLDSFCSQKAPNSQKVINKHLMDRWRLWIKTNANYHITSHPKWNLIKT